MDININPASSQSQTSRILDWMLAGNRFTPLEALNLFGCFRLPARIADIKAAGYDVRSRFVSTNMQKKVKQYWIKTTLFEED